MGETMQAVVVQAPGEFGVEKVPLPECPAGGMLLKVDACGLCGSDLRTLRHGHREVALPWIIGHEICGTVVELGRDCGAPWSVGDALSVGPLVFCGECDFCVRGEMELCEDYREIAQAWHGGFAEYVAIPGEAVERGTIRPVPSGLDPAVAAIAEPVSSCIHAQEKGRVGLGDTVAILGTGPIGCTHICLAGVHGADRVIAADINDARLELAEQFGPDHTINAERSDLVAEVRRLTDGQGADVVVTANPAPVSQVQAVEMARKGGRILLFGGLPKDGSTPGIDTNLIHYNALTVMGTTIFAPRHQIAALRLLRDGRIPGDRLVTHRLPLAEFRKGVELAFKGEVLKAVFLP